MAEPSHWKDQPLRLPASSLALRKPGNWLAGWIIALVSGGALGKPDTYFKRLEGLEGRDWKMGMGAGGIGDMVAVRRC